MTPAARSLFAFGCLDVVNGLGLVVIPGVLLGLLGFPPPADFWVRVLGVLAVAVGVIHMTSARNELTPYFRTSVPIRLLFAAGLVGLVLAELAPVSLVLLAALDVAGAVWTALALRHAPVGERAAV